MSIRTITGLVLLGTVLALLVWEACTLSVNEPGDTISEVLVYWSRKYPLITLALGMFMGHLFWPIKSYDIQPPEAPPTATAQKAQT